MLYEKELFEFILTKLDGTPAEKYINRIDDLLESMVTDQDITEQEELLLFNYMFASMNDFLMN